MKNLRVKINSIYYLIAFSFLLYCCVILREEIFSGVVIGVEYSLQNLIPSLFPMIFIACAINNSSAKTVISYIFSSFCRKVLKLPQCCACAVIFGLCLGYPIGAKLTSILLKNNEISKDEASRLILFCVNPGIPFTVVFVGGYVFQNVVLGFYIFLSTVIASLFIGFIISIKIKSPSKTKIKYSENSFTNIVAQSASQSLSSTLTMCLYITIFSAFSPLISYFSVLQNFYSIPFFSNKDIASVFWFILEITSAISNAVNLNAPLEIFIFGLSFGGLCVHLQVFSFFDKCIVNFKLFYLCRLIHSALCLSAFKFIIYMFPIEQTTSSNITNFNISPSTGTATTSICLILLSCTFIYLNKTKS